MEWAKAKACADRWEEEVILLDEEMRRVLEFCMWKAGWWLDQAPRREDVSESLVDGLRAYAQEQADQERRICSTWRTKWASARHLAKPILDAFWGVDPAIPMQEVVEGPVMIDLDIDEGEEGDNAGDSDFEE